MPPETTTVQLVSAAPWPAVARCDAVLPPETAFRAARSAVAKKKDRPAMK
jgi:hypothetical protein